MDGCSPPAGDFCSQLLVSRTIIKTKLLKNRSVIAKHRHIDHPQVVKITTELLQPT